jgi:hypothetical protein
MLTVVIGLVVDKAGAQLPAITITEAGADAERRPFVRWMPDYPIVNIRVSTRPVSDPTGQPSSRHWVQAASYDRAVHGPAPFWRGADDPLAPGVYYTAIQGDAAFQGLAPWTPFKSFRVSARPGEWTGHTTQKRYIRFTRSSRGRPRGLAFSVYAPACGTYASVSLPGEVRTRKDGSFSVSGRGVSRRWIGTANVRIAGRVRRGFARGVLRVDDLFEGCSSGRVSWAARRR